MGSTRIRLPWLKPTLERPCASATQWLQSTRPLSPKSRSFRGSSLQEDPHLQDIINKTERLEAAKGDVEKQVNDTNKRIKGEEELIDGINQSGTKVTADANRLRDTIKTLESNCEKCEEDKSTKDNQIHTLREEIAHQEELISKLQKEKKGAGEGRQKAEEDIQAMEDRCNHLSKVKGKLEQSLDEEDALEREKKSKG